MATKDEFINAIQAELRDPVVDGLLAKWKDVKKQFFEAEKMHADEETGINALRSEIEKIEEDLGAEGLSIKDVQSLIKRKRKLTEEFGDLEEARLIIGKGRIPALQELVAAAREDARKAIYSVTAKVRKRVEEDIQNAIDELDASLHGWIAAIDETFSRSGELAGIIENRHIFKMFTLDHVSRDLQEIVTQARRRSYHVKPPRFHSSRPDFPTESKAWWGDVNSLTAKEIQQKEI